MSNSFRLKMATYIGRARARSATAAISVVSCQHVVGLSISDIAHDQGGSV